MANRLTGETVSGSEGYAYTYNYDDSGNLLSKVKNQNNTETVEIQNTYDAFNRMVQTAISSSGNVTYRYDSSGHRISKTSAGVVTNHIWDGDNIISDLTANKPVQNYIYGASGIEAIALSGTGGQHTVSAYLKNAHGDVVGVRSLGNTGNFEYKYDSYGNELLDTSGIENPFRYSGQYFDSETGYYYLRARYYDPQSGRFTQEDTYHGEPSDPATLNLYGYCAANPVRYQDSSGHWLETVFDVVSLGFSVYDMFKEPSWVNFGFLVWDVASLLPFVPGSYAGKAVKTIGKIDDVADTLKIVKRTVDAVDTVMDTGKAIKKSVSTADKISDVAKTAKKSIKAALSTSSKDIVAEAAAKQKKLIKRTQDTVSQLKSKASQAVKKIDFSVGKLDDFKSVETTGKRVDFYVTPQGDAIPGTKAGLERNLSMMKKSTNGANVKYIGTNSAGVQMRVRPEGIHPPTDVAAHKKNPYHEVPHIHFEYKKNIFTGGWGDGFGNNHILPQSWFK